MVLSREISESKNFDLAFLRLTTPIGKIVSPSRTSPIIGSEIFTVGSPIDGLVLSRGKLVRAFTRLDGDWLELEIAADHGNSGGPVFTTSGFVGIVISKNLVNARINAYTSNLILREFDIFKTSSRGQSPRPITMTTKVLSSPLNTEIISAIIAFVFGVLAGIAMNRRHTRRLRKKRIRIVI